MLANESLSLRLEREQIASICAEAEHHPDNVGAATFGGAVLSIKSGTSESSYVFSPIEIERSIALIFAVPDIRISTSSARAALPSAMPYATTVSAVGKASALIQGLVTADSALLAYALDDVVHVPFRSHLIPGYDSVVAAATSAGGYGATLSGSGSAIVAVGKENVAARIGAAMRAAWSKLGQEVEIIVQTKQVPGASATESAD